jgi:cytoskeleton protein RodZ
MPKSKSVSNSEKFDEGSQEAGQDIKSAREARGLTLNDVFELTKIGTTNLDAIENEAFHCLPPPVYARSFIKAYANLLNVDSTAILSRYEIYRDAMKSPPEDVEVKKKRLEIKRNFKVMGLIILIVVVSATVLIPLLSHRKSNRIETMQAPPAKSIVSGTQSGGTDAATGTKLPDTGASVNSPNTAGSPAIVRKADVPAATSAALSQTESKVAATANKTVESPESYAKKEEIPLQKSYAMTIAARELTWIRIVEDQNPPYEAMLKPGDLLERGAKQRILLHIGNAGGVDVVFQGRSLGNLGKHGQVVHLSLP